MLIPPDWLNAFTCVTVTLPGPAHAAAELFEKVLLHAAAVSVPDPSSHRNDQVTLKL